MRQKRKPQDFPRTDSGNAELIATLFGHTLRYDHRQGRWLIWDKDHRRWEEDATNRTRSLAKNAARYRAEAALNISDNDESTCEFKWARQSESRYSIDAALELAKSEAPISDAGNGWDADPWLLGVANGIVDLRTGELRAATEQDRITKFSPGTFNSAATCPRFQQFLNEVFGPDPELVRYIHKAVGYSLSGHVNEQCVFCCHGSGANGKTTLFEVLRFILGLGEYAVNLPFSALELKNRNSNDLVALYGTRFATAAETNDGVRLNEARIKMLTGGDTITARRLYHESFTFQPTHKLWLAFNHKPIIADDSEGMWRRVRLIPFARQFKSEEQDKNLPDALRAEAPGILPWAVRGCLLWQKEGLWMPPAVEQATASYREASDHLGQFIGECCVVEPVATVPSGALWQRYEEWVRENEEVPMTRGAFAERLEKRGFQRERSGHERTRVWIGIGLQHGGPGADADTRTPADAVFDNSPVETRM